MNGQNKSITIYSENNEILLPTFEEIISKLLYYQSNEYLIGQNYFNKITNLNKQFADIQIHSKIKTIFDETNFNTNSLENIKSNNEIEITKEINKQILSNEYFMFIKNNIIGDHIEFQIFLYKPKSKINIPDKISSHLVNQINFIVNPVDKDLSRKLKEKIEILFERTNIKPKARLFLDGIEIEDKAKIEVPNNTIIKLDGSYSYDVDDRVLDYKWENSKNYFINDKPFFKSINFKENTSEQNIHIGKNYEYYAIKYWVEDGTEKSNEIEFNLYSSIEPKIDVSDSAVYVKRDINFDNLYDSINIKYFASKYDDDEYIISKEKILSNRLNLNDKEKLINISYNKYSKNYWDTITFKMPVIDDTELYIYSVNNTSHYLSSSQKIKLIPLNYYLGNIGISNSTDIIFDKDSNFIISNYQLIFETRFFRNLNIRFNFPLKKSEIIYKNSNIEVILPELNLRYMIRGNYLKTSTFIGLGYSFSNEDAQIKIKTYKVEFGLMERLFYERKIPIYLNLNIFYKKIVAKNFLNLSSVGIHFGILYNIGYS